MYYYVLFTVGLGLLLFGSHLLIRSLISLSHILKVKPLFLSIVVLGFVTSSAEWVVTFLAAYKGVPEIALANVIGSNTTNILLILGISGLFYLIQKIHSQIIQFDLPFLLGSFLLLALLSYDGSLNRLDGLVCLFVFGTYLFILFQKRSHDEGASDTPQTKSGLFVAVRDLTLGFIGLFLGSHLMIDSSMEIASLLGLSNRFIGIFVLAFGTSLPELATSSFAAFKKEGEMILGNIVGSNIFNSLFVIGSSSLLGTLNVSSELYTDYFFMFFIVFLLLMVAFLFKRVPRSICFLFLVAYIIYVYTLFQNTPMVL